MPNHHLGDFEVWQVGPDYWAVLLVEGRPRCSKGPFSQKADAMAAIVEARIHMGEQLQKLGLGRLVNTTGEPS